MSTLDKSEQAGPVTAPGAVLVAGAIVALKRRQLRAWAGNPRKKFAKDKLKELADSMRSKGQLQNLVVRPLAGRDDAAVAQGITHEVILGERRLRASEAAGLEELLCAVREISDKEAAMEAVMENTHRADLDVEEEAGGYKRMVEEGWEIGEIAENTGKKKEFIYEMLDLLKLDADTLRELADRTITRATARALGRVDDLDQRRHALIRIVNEGGAPLSQKVALEIIKADYLAKQNRQERWAAQEKKLRAAWPAAEIVSVKDAEKYLGLGCGWVRYADRPEAHDLASHLRGVSAAEEPERIPTWGELARKHGAAVVVAPDEKGEAVALVEKGPLEAAERDVAERAAGSLALERAGKKALPANERAELEAAVEGCVFAIPSGPGRHEQSNLKQREEEERRVKKREAETAVRERKRELLSGLQADLLRGEGKTWKRIREIVELLVEEEALPGLREGLEFLGVDVKTLGEGDVKEGEKAWVGNKMDLELQATQGGGGEDLLLFLVVGAAVGFLGDDEEGEKEVGKWEKVMSAE